MQINTATSYSNYFPSLNKDSEIVLEKKQQAVDCEVVNSLENAKSCTIYESYEKNAPSGEELHHSITEYCKNPNETNFELCINLINSGANLDFVNETGSPLFLLVQCCFVRYERAEPSYVNLIKNLLEAGADPNLYDKYGNTAIYMATALAVHDGDTTILKLLLKYGADSSLINPLTQEDMFEFYFYDDKNYQIAKKLLHR